MSSLKSSANLSFGEKKKISLATVLFIAPKLLKRTGRTKIVATHDLDLVWELCTEVAWMDEGMIVVEGNCRDILMDRELLQAHNLEVPASLELERLRRNSG